jgi:small subunit ribosomal protein S2
LGRRHVLFVNERKHIAEAVSEVASSVGESYVMGRWVGGTLTNFKKILVAYNTLLRGKEASSLTRYKWNLKQSLDGLQTLNSLPGVVFFNSTKNNFWGTREAYSLRIPSGAVTDSDALPSDVLYPIPGNDDAFGSIYFLNQLVAKTILISKINLLLNFSKKYNFRRHKGRRVAV